MRLDGKSILLGAAAAVVALLAVGALLLGVASGGGPKEQRHRTLKLASGRSLEVTMLYLGFGDDHSQRGAVDDGIGVEYVTASEGGARDNETAEVFDAIRPLAESLGLGSVSISAFPSLLRKGHYQRYAYSRDAAGAWTSKRSDEKVFANE